MMRRAGVIYCQRDHVHYSLEGEIEIQIELSRYVAVAI